jgi:uncharacterized RDD family membrane protein YckC
MTDPVELQEPLRQGPPPGPTPERRLGQRLVAMVIIWMMLSVAWSVLTLTAVVQFVIMLTSRGEPNARLAEFGEGLGIWVAKATRYQAAASETKPWPWTDID